MTKGLKVALQLYSIRYEVEKDFDSAIKKVREMGYDGVELAGLFGNTPQDVRKMIMGAELDPVSAHVPITELVRDPAGIISDYRQIGCQYIAVPWLDEPRRPGHEDWDKTKTDISNIVKECEKQSITLLYHNHDFEFVRTGKSEEYAFDQLYKEIPALQTEIDTCWVKIAGEDPAAYIREYKSRAPIVHLKDFILTGEKPSQMYELIGADKTTEEEEKDGKFEFRPLGHGLQDIHALIEAAVYSGARWIVVEQDEPSMGKSPLECALISMEYLLEYGGGM
ncbi:MAG: sugar phosphate isomerase/epimerase [Synergistaceae bacterium]|nr:sugar phosphate isomerase/epimerase [Synergistaceae bacterium]